MKPIAHAISGQAVTVTADAGSIRNEGAVRGPPAVIDLGKISISLGGACRMPMSRKPT